MTARARQALFVALGLSVIGGCDSSASKDAATSSIATSTIATSTSATRATSATSATSETGAAGPASSEQPATSTQPFGPGSFDLPDPTTGLAGLGTVSYTHLTLPTILRV